MAQRRQHKDVFARLTETGEEALHKLVELPGGTKVIEAANAMRERVDELTGRMRSLDPLEKRVAELEKRLDALDEAEAGAPTPRTKTAARRARKPARRRRRRLALRG